MVARPVVPQLVVIKTPLIGLEPGSGQHPDGEFVRFVLRGIVGGFRIGFNYQRFSCKPARSNMKSAAENSEVVEEYLFTEQSAGRVIGPLAPETVPFVQISPFGVIPKSEPGKWRLIVDLLSPEGASMNDGISMELCSLSYVRVDDIVPVWGEEPYWPSWIFRQHTAWYLFTQMTVSCWEWYGKGVSTLIQLCHLGCDLPPRYSIQLRMP